MISEYEQLYQLSLRYLSNSVENARKLSKNTNLPFNFEERYDLINATIRVFRRLE